jgi:hypothetical protein
VTFIFDSLAIAQLTDEELFTLAIPKRLPTKILACLNASTNSEKASL